MTAAQPPTWPPGRTLAGWWPHLGRFCPRALWLSHLYLHRIEAPVGVCRPPPLDGVTRLLLEALARAGDNMSPGRLLGVLRLDAQLLGRLLAELSAAGLARSNDAWSVTEAGRQALAGRYEPVVRERRTFYFAEGPPAHRGVRFLPLDRPPTSPSPQGADWHFDAGLLRACVEQSAEWKQRHGFPAEVRAAPEPAEAWQQVIIDRPEQLLVLFVLSGEEQEQEPLLGLAVQVPGWQLQTERPVLTLGAGWREVLPELAEDPGLERWREAWRGWCQPRGLPPGEIEACVLERRGVALVVRAPRPLVERLRAGRSEVLKGETWLLAGEERTRCAAVVELVDL
jgi:hypothetical protein